MKRKIWREKWLNSIFELTSLQLQNETWLNFKNENPHFSFIEFSECYFDLVLDDNYRKALDSGLVNLEEFEILKTWHKKLDNYKSPNNDDYNHYEILDHQNWIEILKEGEKMKSSLSQILSNEEKNILINGKNAA